MDYIIFFKNPGVAASGDYPGSDTSFASKEVREENKSISGNEFVDEALTNFVKTPEGERIVDSVQAMAIYLLLSCVPFFIKDFEKDFPKLDQERDIGFLIKDSIVGEIKLEQTRDLLGYIVKLLGKAGNKNTSNLIYIMYREIRFGLHIQ